MLRNQASATAKVIAAATVFLYTWHPALGLVTAEAAKLNVKFLSTTVGDRLLLLAVSTRPFSWICKALERTTLPGISIHYARRKLTIEREVLAHLQSTASSSVYVLGAGFDTLCLRIAALFPNIHFVELDHPATQAVKIRALAHDISLPVNLEFRSCDLRTTPAQQLFPDPGNRLVIAEGLMMYFSEVQVQTLLAASMKTQASAHAENVCIFSYMELLDYLPAGFRPRSWLIDRWLDFKSEPFLWSANAANLAAVVANAGGQIERLIAAADFEGAAPTDQIRGENLVVARSA